MAKVTLGVKNYQAIENTLLTFEPGITVITGSSNSGKTALFRAAWSLIMNPTASKHHIRDDAQEAVVFLHVENHPKIVWRRKRNTVEYEIDGEVNHKAGRNTIWDLYPEFPLKRESTGEILNFHREHNILFPFGLSPQELFKQFEKVMSIDDSATILKSLKSAKSDLASERGSTYSHVEAAARMITNITTTVVTMSTIIPKEEGSLRLLPFLLQDQDQDQVIELEYIRKATEHFFRPLEKGNPVNHAPVEDSLCTCPPLDPEEAPEGARKGKNVSPMGTPMGIPVESVSRVESKSGSSLVSPVDAELQGPQAPVISGAGTAKHPLVGNGIEKSGSEGVHNPSQGISYPLGRSCEGTEGFEGSEGFQEASQGDRYVQGIEGVQEPTGRISYPLAGSSTDTEGLKGPEDNLGTPVKSLEDDLETPGGEATDGHPAAETTQNPPESPERASVGSRTGQKGFSGSEGNLDAPGGKDSDGHPEPDAVQRIEEVKQTLKDYLRVSEPLEADIAALKLLVPRFQSGTLKVAAAQKAAERLETDLKGSAYPDDRDRRSQGILRSPSGFGEALSSPQNHARASWAGGWGQRNVAEGSVSGGDSTDPRDATCFLAGLYEFGICS